MAEKTTEDTRTRKKGSGVNLASVRAKLAQLVWLVCLACALLLISGALMIALKANPTNELVRFVKDAADAVDLGVFQRNDGVLKFEEGSRQSRMVKNALVNWGLAAVVWLVVGRIASRLVRG